VAKKAPEGGTGLPNVGRSSRQCAVRGRVALLIQKEGGDLGNETPETNRTFVKKKKKKGGPKKAKEVQATHATEVPRPVKGQSGIYKEDGGGGGPCW